MKKSLLICFLVFLIVSCKDKKKNELSIIGNWISTKGTQIPGVSSDILEHVKISFYNGGYYYEISSQDDLVHESKGRWFTNINKRRGANTITLVPDSIYAGKDTIYLPCENWDIIKLNKDSMQVLFPSQFRYVNGKSAILNNHFIFVKSK